MHGGRNYGTLRFEMPQGERSFMVTAGRTAGRDETKKNERRQIEEGRVRLMQLYMDYRLKKIVTGVWANRSSEILDHLAMVEPDEPMYQLMKAQAKIANKQRQEASWIMEDFKRKYTDHTSPEWGYYLYLCTLVEREPSYVDRVTDEDRRSVPQTSGTAHWLVLDSAVCEGWLLPQQCNEAQGD